MMSLIIHMYTLCHVFIQDEERQEPQFGVVCDFGRSRLYILCEVITSTLFFPCRLSQRWMECCRERMSLMKEGERWELYSLESTNYKII